MFVLWVSAFSFLRVISGETQSGSRGARRDTRSWTRRAPWPRGPGVSGAVLPQTGWVRAASSLDDLSLTRTPCALLCPPLSSEAPAVEPAAGGDYGRTFWQHQRAEPLQGPGHLLCAEHNNLGGF